MFKKKDGYKLNYKHLKPWNYLVLKKLIDKTKNGENVTSPEVFEMF